MLGEHRLTTRGRSWPPGRRYCFLHKNETLPYRRADYSNFKTRDSTRKGQPTMDPENEIPSDEHVTSRQPMSRRDAIKATGLAGAAALLPAAVSPAQAADQKPTAVPAKNPYGGVPGGGITFPRYYRPTPSLVSNNIYYPGQEQIGPDISMSITTRTCPTFSPSLRGWGAGSRCASMGHRAGHPKSRRSPGQGSELAARRGAGLQRHDARVLAETRVARRKLAAAGKTDQLR